MAFWKKLNQRSSYLSGRHKFRIFSVKEKIMKRHPFVNTNLIQTLEEEIKSFEEGKSNVEQAKSIVKVAQRLISLKKLEIEEEEKVLRELLRKIKGF
jgi:hypothetical protein